MEMAVLLLLSRFVGFHAVCALYCSQRHTIRRKNSPEQAKISARTVRSASVVSLSNKFVVWLAYVAGKLRLFIVLLPIIALTVIITGYLIRPFRGTPAPQITLFFV